MPGVDVSNFGFSGQPGVIFHNPPRIAAGIGAATMPCVGRIAESHFIALDCRALPSYGSNTCGRASKA